ncbi:MAG TPA: ethanolamine ammonia-lyase light chain EutC [Hyphomicrobium sp.]
MESAAGDRDTYLRRPDLGRRLSAASREHLTDRKRRTSAAQPNARIRKATQGVPGPVRAHAASVPDCEVRPSSMLGPEANFAIERDTRTIELLV